MTDYGLAMTLAIMGAALSAWLLSEVVAVVRDDDEGDWP